MLEPEGKNCDTDYKCECGIEFTVYTNSIGHRLLPESWEQEPRSEIKEAEERAIFDVKMGIGIPNMNPDNLSPLNSLSPPLL